MNGTVNATTINANTTFNASDGYYNLTLFVSDGLQNGSNSVLFRLDTVAPVISNLRNTTTTNQSGFIQWSCSELCNYSILWYNSTSLVNSISNNTFALSHNPFLGSLLNSTTYLINLTVYDYASNSANNKTFNFTTASNIDVVQPIINSVVVNPTNGSAGTLFNITANATDDRGLSSVMAYVQKPDENNTATITLGLSNGLYNGTWNSSGRAKGTYVIDVVANDTSGNSKERENIAAIVISDGAEGIFVNSSVNMTTNIPIIINATSNTDTWLNISMSRNTTATVTITSYSENIHSVSPTSVSALNKYIDIIVDNNTNQNISFAELRVYYTDSEVATANLDESSLRLYKYNESSSSWFTISPGGVNTNLNYVWSNVTSFSSFGVFGNALSTDATTTTTTTITGRAGGICVAEWKCGEWSKCIGGIQTRRCRIAGTCQYYEEIPIMIKECETEEEKYIGEVEKINEEVEKQIIKPAPKERLALKELLKKEFLLRVFLVWCLVLVITVVWEIKRKRKEKKGEYTKIYK